MKVAVILPAAGLGTRMAKGVAELAAGPLVVPAEHVPVEKVPAEKTGTSSKQFMLLDGSPILMHTVRKFLASDRVSAIVIAVRAEDAGWVQEMMAPITIPGAARTPPW